MNKLAVRVVFLSTFISSFSENTIQQPTLSQEHQQNILHSSEQFMKDHAVTLKPHELQIFANIIFYSYAFARIDNQVRSLLPLLIVYSQQLYKAIPTYKPEQQNYDNVVNIVQQLHKSVQVQQALFHSWQKCTHYLESLEKNSTFSTVIELWRKEVQTHIELYTQHKGVEFSVCLQTNAETLKTVADSFDKVTDIYDKLCTEAVPTIEKNLQEIAKISLASQACNTVENGCWQVLNDVLIVRQHENAVQKITYDIMKHYYQALYSYIVNLDQQYKTILFNDGTTKTIDQLPEPSLL